jgi:hypothetical protein
MQLAAKHLFSFSPGWIYLTPAVFIGRSSLKWAEGILKQVPLRCFPGLSVNLGENPEIPDLTDRLIPGIDSVPQAGRLVI